MTETMQKSKQLSLGELQTLFEQSYPQLVEPFKLAKPKLEDGTGQQDLANLIGCEVAMRQESGLHIYSWSGTKGNPHEMRVPRAFEPQPIRANETQQQAQIQEAEPTPELEVFEPATEGAEAELKPAPKAAPENVASLEVTTSGMFAVLAKILGDATLLMTVARTDEAEGEPRLTVTVVPEGESDLSPICLSGTPGELDTHFVNALTSRADTKAGLEAQIEALKAADEALEEAKKEEVAAKNKQTEAKKKATQKKEAEAHAEAEEAKKKAEADKQKVELF